MPLSRGGWLRKITEEDFHELSSNWTPWLVPTNPCGSIATEVILVDRQNKETKCLTKHLFRDLCDRCGCFLNYLDDLDDLEAEIIDRCRTCEIFTIRPYKFDKIYNILKFQLENMQRKPCSFLDHIVCASDAIKKYKWNHNANWKVAENFWVTGTYKLYLLCFNRFWSLQKKLSFFSERIGFIWSFSS